MDNAPERIWLQWEDHAGESTWCQDPINDEDVKYVRADLIEAQLQEARAVLRIIAGYEQCTDNLMSNADIARAFLVKSY